MTPVCSSCKCLMRCEKTGRKVELRVNGEPYQLWSGDEYRCPMCQVRVVATFARECLDAHADFDTYAALRQAEADRANLIVIYNP